MVNVEFLVVTYFVSLFVDWVFQWQWQAINKSKWSREDNKIKSGLAVTSHSLIYALITTIISLKLINQMNEFLIVFTVLFVSHVVIDTRIPVKYIMRFKGLTWNEIYDYQSYGFMHIGIDHRLHEITILILSIFV